ncbi:hypothetical protein AAFF_G00182120 [Aldrovandia affinis]|uniref:Uncharacterized protein n=1 Tax=Aldrovandia affinis TaxID=143900 RepID=A0AAD7W715_9TELE|nr:hypothetical protein AAFF_G00182120 [Aldrovandia affinis]
MEQERKAASEENKRVLEQRLKEQSALEEGFQSMAQKMQSEIQSLHHQYNQSIAPPKDACSVSSSNHNLKSKGNVRLYVLLVGLH